MKGSRVAGSLSHGRALWTSKTIESTHRLPTLSEFPQPISRNLVLELNGLRAFLT